MKKVEINCDVCDKEIKENEYIYNHWGHRYCSECFKGAVKTKGKINELQKRIDKAINLIKELACYEQDTDTYCRDIIYYDIHKIVDELKGRSE